MASLVNDEGGVRYLKGLRSPSSTKEYDTEAKKIAIELPDVPLLTTEDNPSKWDLVFVCSDGIVFAHRLVISNASKYIMHMFDDQPPWYTTYIHVLDLPRHIVQLLVDLAYTGEMRLTEELQSDVIDAMHTLGWVHTDCLSVYYDVAGDSCGTDVVKSPKKERKDKEGLTPVGEKSGRSDKSPSRRNSDKNSSMDGDDSKMEISHLPDIDFSDVEEEEVKEKTLTSSSAPNSTSKPRRGRPPGKNKSEPQKDENDVPKKKPQKDTALPSSTRKSVRRSSSISETNEVESEPVEQASKSGTKDKQSPSTTKQQLKGKGATNLKKTPTIKTEIPPTPTKPKTNKDMLVIDETSQASNISDSTSQLDSPTKRQRRKPKRFEEYEELEKPKARTSPVKLIPAAEVKPVRVKKAVETDANGSDKVPKQTIKNESAHSSKDGELIIELPTTSTSKIEKETSGTTNRSLKTKVAPKKKLSNETPKHSLITAYFSKKDSKTETEDSSDLSQECIETNEPNTITAATSELSEDGNNQNDNKFSANLPPPLEDNTDASTLTSVLDGNKEQETDCTDTDPEDEMPTLTDEKQDNKKRSFDEIRSSHNIDEPRPATTTETDSGESEIRENGDESVVKPARKSSRTASKAQSTEEDEQNGDDNGAPKRKRSRTNSTEVIAKDPTPLFSRRSSRQ